MNSETVFVIARRELKRVFDSPASYVAITVFLVVWEFLFFRNAFLIGESDLRNMFSVLPWLFMLFIPALTMGSISQEKNDGTLELVLTHPVHDVHFVLGKYVGSLLAVSIALLLTLPIAISFEYFGNLDWGQAFAQYLAGVLLASTLVALGIALSSFFSNQVASFLTSSAVSFFLVILGFELLSAVLPLQIAPVLERVSLWLHYDSLTRGVLEVRDVLYFFATTIVFLSLAYLLLRKRRYGNQRSHFRSTKTGVILLIVATVAISQVEDLFPGRLDLTSGKRFTLSDDTKGILQHLPADVKVTLFASAALPVQLQSTLREVRDMIHDYERNSGGKLTVSENDPTSTPAIAQDAEKYGVAPAQFNTVGVEEFQIKRGYLGLAVIAGDVHESIPFIRNTSDLEYQLTSSIQKLTVKDKKKIGVLGGFGTKSFYREYGTALKELEKQFEIVPVTIKPNTSQFDGEFHVLAVAGPTQTLDEFATGAVRQHMQQGKAALFLIDGVTVNPQFFQATASEARLDDVLGEYGISVQPTLVYDTRLHETVQFSSGIVSFLVPYPFWLRAPLAENEFVAAGSGIHLMLPWPSGIAVDDSRVPTGAKLVRVLTTSSMGGSQEAPFVIDPGQEITYNEAASETLGVLLQSPAASDQGKVLRLAVIGDSDFLMDQFVERSPENLAFVGSTISWLAGEPSLAHLRVKQTQVPRLMFTNATQVAAVQYGNIGFVLLAPAMFGWMRLRQRRAQERIPYHSG